MAQLVLRVVIIATWQRRSKQAFNYPQAEHDPTMGGDPESEPAVKRKSECPSADGETDSVLSW
jgi:hypothetical protein